MTQKTSPILHHQTQPEITEHLGKTHELMAQHGLPKMLAHLIELRVSQINGCSFCVKMHIAEARADGETNERLDRVVVWRHVNDFTPAEKAALEWAEALTLIDSTAGFGELRAKMREYYSDEVISVITACVAMINLWNRVQVSTH